jgi:CheY-like chemotaxis protein
MMITSGLTESTLFPYKNKHILLIDDDSDDQLFFKEILEELNMGFTCGFASNGRDGLAMMKEMPQPDVIFVDLNMPVMNGFQYLEMVKNGSFYSNIPIVMLTTSNAKTDKEKARNLGAVGFISKPDSFHLFREILKETLVSLFG